eukprot:7278233-Prymnesium_polylepis.1
MAHASSHAAPDCCVAPHSCVPRNASLVLMGDSLTRYQYLDLVFQLHASSANRTHHVARSPLDAHEYRTWSDFLHSTNRELQPLEACDCLRSGRPSSPNHGQKWENR